MPVMVPPVPTPHTKWVIRPAVWRQISGPVVSYWAWGLFGLWYWSGFQAFGSLAGQPVGHRVVRVGVLGLDAGGAHDDLGAVGPELGDLVGRHLVGADEDAAVAPAGGDDGQADAGVAAGGLDDGAARLQHALALGGVDHGQRRPVLAGEAGVEQLELGQQRAVEVVGRCGRGASSACRR